MRILGHGVDIIEIDRITRLRERHPERFLDRLFTPSEQAYCLEHKYPDEHFAVRFAAKEAVLKAIGTGWRNGIAWTDIQVVVEPSGRPCVRLEGLALAAAMEVGITQWLLSLSHSKTHAIASAIASG